MSTMRNLPHVIAVGGSVAATPSSVFGSFWRLRLPAAGHNGAELITLQVVHYQIDLFFHQLDFLRLSIFCSQMFLKSSVQIAGSSKFFLPPQI